MTALFAEAASNICNGDETPGIYTTPGGSDEYLRIFLLEKTVSKEELDSYQGKCTGALEEDEHITLQVIPFSKLRWITSDGKTLIALALHDGLQESKSL